MTMPWLIIHSAVAERNCFAWAMFSLVTVSPGFGKSSAASAALDQLVTAAQARAVRKRDFFINKRASFRRAPAPLRVLATIGGEAQGFNSAAAGFFLLLVRGG